MSKNASSLEGISTLAQLQISSFDFFCWLLEPTI
jgi:hypothetical protein